MKNIKFFYYYVFFNAYWTSFDLGEKTIPRQNAVYYMNLVGVFILSFCYFATVNLGVSFGFGYIIISGGCLLYIVNLSLFSEKKFQEFYSEFLFLKNYKKTKRYILFFTIAGVPAVLNLVSAFVFSLK